MNQTDKVTYKGYEYLIYQSSNNEGYLFLETDTHYGIFSKAYLYYTEEEAYELFYDSLKKHIDTRFDRIFEQLA
jgi:hypothetical protein